MSISEDASDGKEAKFLPSHLYGQIVEGAEFTDFWTCNKFLSMQMSQWTTLRQFSPTMMEQ
jgi:hypothetical protein